MLPARFSAAKPQVKVGGAKWGKNPPQGLGAAHPHRRPVEVTGEADGAEGATGTATQAARRTGSMVERRRCAITGRKWENAEVSLDRFLSGTHVRRGRFGAATHTVNR